MTEAFANSLQNWSIAAFVAGSILLLLGGIGSFWSGNINSSNAKQSIADTKAELATAKADLERQKSVLSIRGITDQQRMELRALLADRVDEFPTLRIGVIATDAEAIAYAYMIHDFLRFAGLKTDQPVHVQVAASTEGILFASAHIDENKFSKELQRLVHSALVSIEVDHKGWISIEVNPPVDIIVGVKALPLL